MRILMYYPISTWRESGPLTHMVSVADGLGALGHEVLLVTRKPYRPLKGQFRLLAMPPRPFYITRFGLGVVSRQFLLSALMRIWRADCVYHRFVPDPAVYTIMNCRSVRRVCECIVTYEWLREHLVETTASPTTRSLLYRQLCEAHGVVVFHYSPLRFLVSELGLTDRPILKVTDGFDPRLVVKSPQRSGRGEFVVGTVTSGNDRDDLDTLIRAAIIASKEIPSLRLSVVDGSQGQKGLTEMCNRLGMSFDKLVVQRCVPHEQIGEFLASLDVAVLLFRKFWLAKNLGCESTRFSEFLGAGCPVIASDVPGSPSYPLSQRGLFIAVPPEDPQALSEALVKLYRDAALRRRIGAAAQQYAFAERTWLHIASRIEGLIASVAKQ